MLALFIRLRNVIGARCHGPDLLFMADLTGNGNAKLQKRNKV